MSLKINENLFLGLPELRRFQEFLSDKGFKRHTIINTAEFGIIENSNFPDLGEILKEDSFYVSKAGTPFDEVIINKGVALNSNADLIINKEQANLSIPNDNLWYWIKISHNVDYREVGSVSVDSFGNVSGIGTKFTEVLRGQPNFPTKIRFENSENGNVDDYEVVRIIDDENCIISGDFNNEIKLKYSVVGTFTPGSIQTNEQKRIYKFDSVKIELIAESTFNQAPASIENNEFFIARVRNNGIDLSLQDKRKKWWKSISSNYLRDIDRISNNPLIGVEAVKFDISTSPRYQNNIELGFGFRIKSYTIDTSAKKISILIGNGGKYKDTSFLQTGDFNGWRIYTKNGDWKTIIDSQKTGTQMVITLDVLNPNDFVNLPEEEVTNKLFIAPPYEEIEIKVRRDGGILDVDDVDLDNVTDEPFPNDLIERNFNFNINTPLARFKVPSPDGCYKYNFTYRYKIQNEYTDWKKFPDSGVGYYSEESFDSNGNLLPEEEDRVLKSYVGDLNLGFIEVCEHPNSFQNFQDLITTGDLFGVNTTSLENSIPIVNLEVGVNKKYQHFKGNLELEANMYIHLRRKNSDDEFFREGNEFILHIEQFITPNDFKILIVEDYLNPTDYTLVKEITKNDIAYIKNNTDSENRNGLYITCTYNENNHWICQYDSDVTPIGTVRMMKGNLVGKFSFSTGEGIRQGFWGWKIIEDMNGVLVGGTNDLTQPGNMGGSESFTLDIEQIPSHRHGIKGKWDDRNTSGGGFTINQVSIQDPPTGQESFSVYTGGLPDGTTKPVNFIPRYKKFLFIEKIV